jgi:hypothetical protein
MCITRFAICAIVALTVSACEAEKSRNPLSPNVAGPIAGVNLSVPTPIAPVNGTEVVNNQPLRLTFNNSTSNGERPFWYIVELASDAGFANKMFANSKVMPASGGQTTIVVDGILAAERTYFWRVKADDGANSSEFSTTARFDLVIPVVLEAPVPTSPINGHTTSTNRPTLTVNNGRVEGRAGRVEYWFEIALDQAFAQTLSQQGVERSSSTSTSVTTGELPANTLYYWRVAGYNGILAGPWSSVQSFRTPPAAAPPPPPPPAPGPPPGPSPGGCNAAGPPANWSTAQWRDCFFALIAAKNAGPTITLTAMSILRPELVARGADFQNGWRGDYRPRIFLPVPNCPPATTPNPPPCSYDRTVDLGDFNGPWQWFPR